MSSQKLSGSMFLNFVVLAILLMSAYRKLRPGGLNAFKIGAIMWKKCCYRTDSSNTGRS